MKLSNIGFLYQFFAPITALEHDEWEYGDVDPTSDDSLRTFIRAALIPSFDRFDRKGKEVLKDTLRFKLSQKEFNFNGFWEGTLPLFCLHSRARRFFELLWECLFPNEEFQPVDPTEYVEVDDVNAALRHLGSDQAI